LTCRYELDLLLLHGHAAANFAIVAANNINQNLLEYLSTGRIRRTVSSYGTLGSAYYLFYSYAFRFGNGNLFIVLVEGGIIHYPGLGRIEFLARAAF